jgi:dolichol-phosphate mannosyltransferase
LINDGSDEKCESVFRYITSNFKQVHYLKHEENKGKGTALKTAMQYFRSNQNFEVYDGVVTADADGQHEISDIIALDKRLGLNPSKSIVIGFRDLNSEKMPFRSKIGNKTTAFLFSALYGIKLKDTQSGLRAFSKDVIPWLIDLKGDRFEYETNMLVKSKNTDYQIIEEPISTRYETNHKSHFRSFVDAFSVLKILLSGIISFIMAGAVAGIADIGLFALFSSVLLKPYFSFAVNILISSVVARIFSSIINFIINRFVTFGGKKVSKKSVIKYYFLWCLQLFASYGLVLFLTLLIGGGEVIIKLIVDFILSLLSYQVQMKWVFRKKDVSNE